MMKSILSTQLLFSLQRSSNKIYKIIFKLIKIKKNFKDDFMEIIYFFRFVLIIQYLKKIRENINIQNYLRFVIASDSNLLISPLGEY